MIQQLLILSAAAFAAAPSAVDDEFHFVNDLSIRSIAASPKLTKRQIRLILDVITAEKTEPVELGETVALGMTVPSMFSISPLPGLVVRLIPDFANHAYIVLADGRIAIIEPEELTVVALLRAPTL